MLRLPLLASLVAATALAAPKVPPPKLVDYVVQPGDSCLGITRRMYGPKSRVGTIHRYNKLGDLPHKLKPGQILRLPTREDPTAKDPDAFLTFVRNEVETYTPDKKAGRPQDPLMRGHRVNTLTRSSAEVTLFDESQLQLGEQTLVVILGDASPKVERKGGAGDTTLMSGSLRANLAALAGKKGAQLQVQTAAGTRIGLSGSGAEAQVHVDEKRATRLSVFRGSSQVSAQKKTVSVPAGFGTKVEANQPPPPPRPLPAAPGWSTLPPPLILSSGEPQEVRGSFVAKPGSPVAAFRVQVARDERFNDLVVDTRVPATMTHLVAQGLLGGTYLCRVSAIDEIGLEGPPSPVAQVELLVAHLEPTARARRYTLRPPAGASCTLDGEQLTAAPVPLDRRRPHRLACARGEHSAALTLPAEPYGPLTVRQARLDHRPGDHEGKLHLEVVERGEVPLDSLPVVAEASAGAFAGAAQYDGPGRLTIPLSWSRDRRAVTVKLTVDAEEHLTVPELAILQPPPPPPPVVRPRIELALRLEPGIAAPLADLQAERFSVGGSGLVTGALAPLPLLEVQLTGGYLGLPAKQSGVNGGGAILAGGGLRLRRPYGQAFWIPWLDGNALYVRTGQLNRFGFALGAGVLFRLRRDSLIRLGPFVRYLHIVQADGAADGGRAGYDNSDAKLLTVGVTAEIGTPIPVAATAAGGTP